MDYICYCGTYEYVQEKYDFEVLFDIQTQMEKYDERIFVTNDIYAIIIGIKIKDMKMTETMQDISDIIKEAIARYAQELAMKFEPNYKICYQEFISY